MPAASSAAKWFLNFWKFAGKTTHIANLLKYFRKNVTQKTWSGKTRSTIEREARNWWDLRANKIFWGMKISENYKILHIKIHFIDLFKIATLVVSSN